MLLLYHVIECGRCESCFPAGHRRPAEVPEYLGAKYLRAAYADYVVVPERNLVAIPDVSNLVKAAAFPLGAQAPRGTS